MKRKIAMISALAVCFAPLVSYAGPVPSYPNAAPLIGTEATTFIQPGPNIGNTVKVTAAQLGTYTAANSVVTAAGAPYGVNLGTRFGETIDLKADYHVVCDGSTDNTSAFQSAINAAQGTGTTLGLAAKALVLSATGPSSYCVTGPLTISRPLTIIGQGPNSSAILLKAGSSAPLFTVAVAYDTTNYFTVANLPAQVILQGLWLTSADGHSGPSGAHGLALVNAGSNPVYGQVTLENVQITNMPGDGVFANGWGGRVSAHNVNLQGNWQNNMVANSVSDWRWVDGDFGSAALDNLVLSGSAAMEFVGVNFYTPVRYNINLTGQTQADFVQCFVDLAGQNGVYSDMAQVSASYPPYARFTECHFRWNGQAVNNSYANIYTDLGSLDAHIYLSNSSFADNNNPFGPNSPQYDINVDGGTNSGVSIDSNTTFDRGNILSTGVSNSPVLVNGWQGAPSVYSSNGTVASNSTVYFTQSGQQNTNITNFAATGLCTIIGFDVAASAAPGAGQSFVYTLYANGSPTAMTGTLSGASANSGLFGGANPVSLVWDNFYSLQLVTSAAAASATHLGHIFTRC